MIKLWADNKADWKPHADEEMGYSTMMDLFFNGLKLSNSLSARAVEYGVLYENHTDLVLDIVEIFFFRQVFTPSQISIEGSQEFYLFEVLSRIISLTEYYKLEDERGERYRKKRKEYEEALSLVRKYSDIEITFNGFPKHKNEILKDLEEYLVSIGRSQRVKEIVKCIKNHFDIKAVNSTKRMESLKEWNMSVEKHIREQEKKGFVYKTEINADGTRRTYLTESPDNFPDFK